MGLSTAETWVVAVDALFSDKRFLGLSGYGLMNNFLTKRHPIMIF